jgi:hypothetical protein
MSKLTCAVCLLICVKTIVQGIIPRKSPHRVSLRIDVWAERLVGGAGRHLTGGGGGGGLGGDGKYKVASGPDGGGDGDIGTGGGDGGGLGTRGGGPGDGGGGEGGLQSPQPADM